MITLFGTPANEEEPQFLEEKLPFENSLTVALGIYGARSREFQYRLLKSFGLAALGVLLVLKKALILQILFFIFVIAALALLHKLHLA